MFWADRVVRNIQDACAADIAAGKTLIVRDEKTVSGRVHIGSMRGVAAHGVVSEVLSERGIQNRFIWEHNDFDPFDSVPPQLSEEVFREHLGKPLYAVPSPEPGYANFAEYYAAEFVSAHEKFGATPEYYWAYKDLYGAGKMDALIRTALDKAGDIRRILKEVSGSEKDESWLPISVVCETCGKIMTTRAFDWDGETVAYACERSPDDCVPCGNEGRIIPFGGAAKLFWKAEWAAKWIALSVDIEGGGKDHSTKGGARDVANHIAREVFGSMPPVDIPYEFFLIGGKKMSSSKGRGQSAKDISELLPSSLFRLLLIGKDINQQIDFDSSGESVPRLYDWYDEIATLTRDGVADDFTRLYTLSQLPEEQADHGAPWELRFSQVAFLVQMPHLSLEEQAEAVKGSALMREEIELLEERARYARFWLDTYAPDVYRYTLQQTMPDVSLSEAQREALRTLHAFVSEGEKTGEDIQAKLFELTKETPIAPKELFAALYQLFLARDSGPKAGWFLSVLPRELLHSRLEEATR